MAKKYVVQGSPGRYVVNEAKTQEEIRSGMTYSAALQTANTLNAKANREKKEEASQTSPTSTRYGTNYEPVVKSSDISQVIKNVYLRNGWSKKDIDSYKDTDNRKKLYNPDKKNKVSRDITRNKFKDILDKHLRK